MILRRIKVKLVCLIGEYRYQTLTKNLCLSEVLAEHCWQEFAFSKYSIKEIKASTLDPSPLLKVIQIFLNCI